MKIGKVSFGKEGWESFKGKSKKEQIDFLESQMPGRPGIQKLLKNIPNVKLSKSKRKTSKSERLINIDKNDGKHHIEGSGTKKGEEK